MHQIKKPVKLAVRRMQDCKQHRSIEKEKEKVSAKKTKPKEMIAKGSQEVTRGMKTIEWTNTKHHPSH